MGQASDAKQAAKEMFDKTLSLREVPLFLGAGASMTFGMPTTKGFLKSLQKDLKDSCHKRIVGEFTDNRHFKDIEYVLQALKDIKKSSKNDGWKFISSVLASSDLAKQCGALKGIAPHTVFEELEAKIEEHILKAYSWDFDRDEELVSVYDPVFSALEKATNKITVFTTNYDNAVENYCNMSNQYSCVDGFAINGSHHKWDERNYSIDGIEHPVYLYKLHGSLDWKEHKRHGIIKFPSETHRGAPNVARDIVIMPTRSPKEEENFHPLNKLFKMFAQNLKEARGCIVIGYSFRDDKINEVLLSFIEKIRIVAVISPTAVEDVKNNLFNGKSPTVSQSDDVTFVHRDEKNGIVMCHEEEFNQQNAGQLIGRALDYIDHIDQLISP